MYSLKLLTLVYEIKFIIIHSQIRVSPRMNENIVIEKLLPVELFQKLDSYLKTRTPVTFLTELRGYLQNPPTQPAGNITISFIEVKA